jgi:hypothetical protein
MIERKCLQCQTWNNAEKYCKNCNAPLDPKVILAEEEKQKKIELANTPPTAFQLFAKKCKHHRLFIVRILYHFFYSIGLIFAAIGAALAWLVAMVNA